MSAYLVGLCLSPLSFLGCLLSWSSFLPSHLFVLAFASLPLPFLVFSFMVSFVLVFFFPTPPPPLRPTPIFEIARRSSADRDLRVQCFFTYGTSENKRVKIAS